MNMFVNNNNVRFRDTVTVLSIPGPPKRSSVAAVVGTMVTLPTTSTETLVLKGIIPNISKKWLLL